MDVERRGAACRQILGPSLAGHANLETAARTERGGEREQRGRVVAGARQQTEAELARGTTSRAARGERDRGLQSVGFRMGAEQFGGDERRQPRREAGVQHHDAAGAGSLGREVGALPRAQARHVEQHPAVPQHCALGAEARMRHRIDHQVDAGTGIDDRLRPVDIHEPDAAAGLGPPSRTHRLPSRVRHRAGEEGTEDWAPSTRTRPFAAMGSSDPRATAQDAPCPRLREADPHAADDS